MTIKEILQHTLVPVILVGLLLLSRAVITKVSAAPAVACSSDAPLAVDAPVEGPPCTATEKALPKTSTP
jgi:hypothetical protein